MHTTEKHGYLVNPNTGQGEVIMPLFMKHLYLPIQKCTSLQLFKQSVIEKLCLFP